MRKQFGMTQGWMLLIGVVVLVVAVTLGIKALRAYEERIDSAAFDRGKNECTTNYTQRDNAALLAVTKERDALVAQAREKERIHVEQTATLTNQLRKDKDNEVRKLNTVIAGLRDGSISLRDPGGKVAASSSGASGTSGTSEAVTTSAGTNAEAGCKLSQQAAEFLSSEASRADQIVTLFNAALEQIAADRKACAAR